MKKRLWILRPIDEDKKGGPWDPWYDRMFGIVVAAESEMKARIIASDEAGDEGKAAWLDPKLTACWKLLPNGNSSPVIMRDVHSA